jgi:hypothetical protein
VQLDLYTQIILSVLSVYQSTNKSICNNDTRWKLKINELSFFENYKKVLVEKALLKKLIRSVYSSTGVVLSAV